MARKKKVETLREWHLYSVAALTSALAFIVILFAAQGTPQVIGLVFVGTVTTVLTNSADWNGLSPAINQGTTMVSTIVILLLIALCASGLLERIKSIIMGK